ncbi:MAG: UDP-N-acetylmuramoyl-L-alanine--D-glutamate ligase [Clostridia bacterium]|nr:UDP-N-acetylmuramoyl-L-alanine--D-glutamate ligase [Clostridia bacterium]
MSSDVIKKALIFGKGESGQGAYILLKRQCTYVSVCDETDYIYKVTHDLDLIVVSPGISIYHPVFSLAKSLNIPVIGEIELGAKYCEKPVIAVTGTNGKTTVTRMINAMLSSKNSCACGNIGVSFCRSITKNYDVFVVEASSFQLETAPSFHPHIAVITNIAVDHIDRHKCMENYVNIKLGIAKNQTKNDCLIMSFDDIPMRYLKGFYPDSNVYFFSTERAVKGAYAYKDYIYFCDEKICKTDRVRAQGKHNLSNALASVCVAKLTGVSNANIVSALSSFVPDAHRLEYVDSVKGVSFYNDSKGTNISATLKAMQSMHQPYALILGGSDKGYGFGDLFDKENNLPQSVFAIGVTAKKIMHDALTNGYDSVEICKNLKDATLKAYNSGAKSVLLSPATASFDAFSSYKARGEAFCEYVKEIKSLEN